ncbi:MAG TPA: DUF499 domain-containing protein [Dehalococcoidia bacterium]|nr:DUF499 domain-containing protein [Dehalococcoidia bacterium]
MASGGVPWREMVTLRDDLRSGELPLSMFAADLYDVVMGRARKVYQDPREFFVLTYPTFNLRELVKDVLLRLAGKNDKAVRQLELTYGGGKTHALITLYHLVTDPAALPDAPAVHEFRQHAGGIELPRARVAVLPFDKLDVEKGMETRAPDGRTRWLRHPWSVLAYQIGGDDGLRLLHAEGRNEERDTPPAENLLRDLLARPAQDGLATLVLIDEVLMYAREKVGLDPQWRHRLQDFFQYLTQAATSTDRTAVVASLLATDPRKSDELGKEIARELYAVFRREKEEGVEPVQKEDVAEILRRRFFQPETVRDRERFRAAVVAALEGVCALDEDTRKNRQREEERYLDSYPFHPELTEVLYTKWTQLEGFQRTRGVLRTFAMALRDAEAWDTSPLIGPAVFLNAPGQAALSDAARELASIAATEEYEGKRQEWSAILQGELAKAREIQEDHPALAGREVEQAVMAVFLHSQPIGQRVFTPNLLVLLGASRPDKIELEKALLQWTGDSYFLDDTAFEGADDERPLPKWWRLGTRPNLKQMHSDACQRVSPVVIDEKVREFVAKEKRLTAGAQAAGARVHNLPDRPRDVDDDGDFHYVVLHPDAACDPASPSATARRFIEETTGPERPRVYRNAILLVAPSSEGVELIRTRVREYLGWEEVKASSEYQAFDDTRKALVNSYIEKAKRSVPDAVVQAYTTVVTVNAKNEIEAFRVSVNGQSTFDAIREDPRSRIQTSVISPEALLPDGPYELWQGGETRRRASDIISAFAQFPRLPKMLRQQDVVDTLALGIERGYFVLSLRRPDGSVRTFWRERPDATALRERDAEVLLPEAAELSELPPDQLKPGALPGLWPAGGDTVTVGDVAAFFDGSHAFELRGEGYVEQYAVPRASREVVQAAIIEAVRAGHLWLTVDGASLFKEEPQPALLTDGAELHPPPPELSPTELLPQNLPDAWRDGCTTVVALADALSKRHARTLPWATIASVVDAALRARLLERTEDSGPWPAEASGASDVRLQVPAIGPAPAPAVRRRAAEADLTTAELQDFVDALPEVLRAASGVELRITLRLELAGEADLSDDELAKLNEALKKASDKLRF